MQLTFTNGLAAELCPLPKLLTCCLFAASDVFVTGEMWLPPDGIGDGAAEPMGVTEGFHVAPPLLMVLVVEKVIKKMQVVFTSESPIQMLGQHER